MIWALFVTLLVLWVLGMMGGIGGQFIRMLLLAAGVVVAFNLIRSRRKAF